MALRKRRDDEKRRGSVHEKGWAHSPGRTGAADPSERSWPARVYLQRGGRVRALQRARLARQTKEGGQRCSALLGRGEMGAGLGGIVLGVGGRFLFWGRGLALVVWGGTL